MNPFYWTIRAIFRPILRVFNRLEVHGVENFQQAGPFLVVANHHSYLDAFVLGAAAPRKIHFMVKRSHFEKWWQRWFYWGMDAFAVREDGSDQEALRNATRILRNGGVVGLFPAGERSFDLGAGEWRVGVGLISKRASAPVLPVAIVGTHESFPRGSTIPKPTKVHVVFGEAVDPPKSHGRDAYEQFALQLRDRFERMMASKASLASQSSSVVEE